MNEIVLNILIVVATAIGTGLAGLVALGFAELNKWLATRTKNANFYRAAELLQKLVQDAVYATQQTFVEQLKKDGKFDANAQKEALQKAINAVLLNLTPDTKALIEDVYGDIVAYITLLIESLLAK